MVDHFQVGSTFPPPFGAFNVAGSEQGIAPPTLAPMQQPPFGPSMQQPPFGQQQPPFGQPTGPQATPNMSGGASPSTGTKAPNMKMLIIIGLVVVVAVVAIVFALKFMKSKKPPPVEEQEYTRQRPPPQQAPMSRMGPPHDEESGYAPPVQHNAGERTRENPPPEATQDLAAVNRVPGSSPGLGAPTTIRGTPSTTSGAGYKPAPAAAPVERGRTVSEAVASQRELGQTLQSTAPAPRGSSARYSPPGTQTRQVSPSTASSASSLLAAVGTS